MPRIKLETRISAPVQTCFDISRDVTAHVASMKKGGQRAIAGITSGPMSLGDTVTWESKQLGLRWHMTSKIVEFDAPHSFVDQMMKGPFGRWRHLHRFEPDENGTRMIDEVDYRSPFGPVGVLVDSVFLAGYMRRLLLASNRHLKHLAESQSPAEPPAD